MPMDNSNNQYHWSNENAIQLQQHQQQQQYQPQQQQQQQQQQQYYQPGVIKTMQRRTSEYASVTPRSLIKDVEHQMSKSDCDVSRNKGFVSNDSAAILKITEKYDSLGSLRASLEKLDLINDIVNELDSDHVLNQKKDHSYDGVGVVGCDGDDNNDDDNENAGDDHDDDDDDDDNDDDQHIRQGGVDKDHHRTSSTTVTRHFYNHSNSIDVSDVDILQVETFFRSHKTVVNVCPTLANVYFSTTTPSTTTAITMTMTMTSAEVEWQLAYTGIPVLLLDSGETRSRTKKRIQIVISEKGTGFLLWKDTIDNLSNYRAVDAHFHTMYLSSDHRRMAGLSFDNASAAREFYDRIEALTSDPANISLSGPCATKAAKKAAAAKQKLQRRKDRVRLPNKTDISQPCCFQHITRVELSDREQFVTLATLTGNTVANDRKATTTTTTSDIVARPN